MSYLESGFATYQLTNQVHSPRPHEYVGQNRKDVRVSWQSSEEAWWLLPKVRGKQAIDLDSGMDWIGCRTLSASWNLSMNSGSHHSFSLLPLGGIKLRANGNDRWDRRLFIWDFLSSHVPSVRGYSQRMADLDISSTCSRQATNKVDSLIRHSIWPHTTYHTFTHQHDEPRVQ